MTTLAQKKLDTSLVPEHIAIVMDGNRRWAKKRGLPQMTGHSRGVDALVKVVKAAKELGVKTLTVYAFSTENWKRSPLEVKVLMQLFKTHFIRQRKKMVRDGVCLDVIGDISKLPLDVQTVLNETKSATSEGTKFNLVIALNYGARDEIKRAVWHIVEDCLSKKLSKDSITEDVLASYLDTAKWKDPDLLIRTSGENRISNFLLWQISYCEIYVTDVLWPDFDEKDLLAAVLEYQKREMRVGT